MVVGPIRGEIVSFSNQINIYDNAPSLMGILKINSQFTNVFGSEARIALGALGAARKITTPATVLVAAIVLKLVQ